MLDYIRIACAVPQVQVANVEKNTQDICEFIAKADAQNVDVLLFPELAMTGYSCADLFLQDALHDAVEAGLVKILECSAQFPQLTVVVGLPVRNGMKIFNCAAWLPRHIWQIMVNSVKAAGSAPPRKVLPSLLQGARSLWTARPSILWLTPFWASKSVKTCLHRFRPLLCTPCPARR